MNEAQLIQDHERQLLGNSLFRQGGILNDFQTTFPSAGHIAFDLVRTWLYGHVEQIEGVELAYDPAKVLGVDTIYARWLMDQITSAQDPLLVAPATGEDVEERIRIQTTLATSSPDLFDEEFRVWVGNVPLNWNLISGSSAIGYPTKFDGKALLLQHIDGTDTIIEKSLLLAPSTHYYVYFWARSQDGTVLLSVPDNAKLGLYRTSPLYTQELAFATLFDYERKTFNFTTDGSFTGTQQAVSLRITIPAAIVSTQILVDAILITTSPLADLELSRHFIPLFNWDRATDDIRKVIHRAGQIHHSDWRPYLDARDIINVELNEESQRWLARRTFDAHSHFHLPGGLIVARNTLLDAGGQLGLEVSPGKGYVHGFEAVLHQTEPFLIDKALATATIEGEQTQAIFGNEQVGANLYRLEKDVESFPIQSVTQLTITQEVVKQVTKGNPNAVDDTGETSVSQILSVSKGGAAGVLVGSVGADSFTFSQAHQALRIQTCDYDTGALLAEQVLFFATGSFSMAQVLEALNRGSGPAFRSGKILGNIIFESDGSSPPHLQLKTKTLAAGYDFLVTTGNANSIFGFTNNTNCLLNGTPPTGTHYDHPSSWQRSGNFIDWSPGGAEPTTGQSYQVVLEHSKNVVTPTDFVLGGFFLAPQTFYYVITAIDDNGEGLPSAEFSGTVQTGGIILVQWASLFSVNNTRSYNIYRGTVPGGPYGLARNRGHLDNKILNWYDSDYITPDDTTNPPTGSPPGPTMLNLGFATTLMPGWLNFNTGGALPVDGTEIIINYGYYQPRIDLVVIGMENPFLPVVSVVEGQYADLPVPPVPDPFVLPLAQCQITPNSATIVIKNLDDYDRPTVADLRLLIKRNETLYENDANQEIANSVVDRDATAKKGVFSDGMTREEQSDFAFDRAGVTYSSALNSALRLNGMSSVTAQIGMTQNGGTTTTRNRRGTIMLPDDATTPEVPFIEQLLWSEDQSINPYVGLRAPQATVRLYPRFFGWSMQKATALSAVEANSRRYTLLSALWRRLIGRFLPPWNTDAEAIRTRSRQRILRDLKTLYRFDIEQLTIDIEGFGYQPNEDLIAGTFGGLPIDLTPTSPTVAGSASVNGKTTILANALGSWQASLVVPVGVPLGIVDLVTTVGGQGRGRANFTPLSDVIPVVPLPEQLLLDPLAQGITPQGFAKDVTLSSIKLCFTSKPIAPYAHRPELYVQILEMDNGYPTRRVLYTQVLSPDDITVQQTTDPLTGGRSWVPTTITFDRWIRINNTAEVAISLVGDEAYRILTATLGQKDQNGKVIASNSYRFGSMFTSADGATWTAHQETDWWMQVYTRKFNPTAIFEMNVVDVTAQHYSRFWLGVDQDIPRRSHIRWEYEAQDGKKVAFAPYEKFRPQFFAPTSLLVRAYLTGDADQPYTSPTFNRRSFGMIGFARSLADTHISEAILFTQNVTKVKLYPTQFIPPGCSITWYAGVEDLAGNVVWSAAFANPVQNYIDGTWYEYGYDELTLPGTGGNKIRLRAELTATYHWQFGPAFAQVGATFV